jgi:formylmethanofuran dehydrogenase subunit C
VRVLGDAGVEVGYKMSGGEICVEGNAGNWTGDNMSGGEIYIKGNAENWTGPFMSNGILRIDGDVGSFHKTAFCSKNKGTIIWKKQKIWENGQKVEPGWTNLDVKGKIA